MSIDLKKLPARHVFNQNTFFVKERGNKRDLIEVEVGDSKVSDSFLPQIKIKRWNNLANVSIRLIDDELGELFNEGEKLVLEAPKKRIEYHSVAESGKYPDGGYEFNIVLKEKPIDNLIRFSIQTKGVEFFYQDILAEFNSGISVSDESLANHGSYAVYLSEKRDNVVGGNLYRSGKVGHIFRPLIYDSAGNSVYGKLNVSKSDGELTVEIPQEFLEKAVYPVFHAAGLTFGYTSTGASNRDFGVNQMVLTKGTPASSGNVTDINAYTSSYYSTSNNYKVVLVDSGKTIVSNGVGGTFNTNSGTKSWKTGTYSTSPSVTGSNNYWACLVSDGNNAQIAYDTGSTGDAARDNSNSYASPTNPTDAVENSERYSIYANYTSGTTTNSERDAKITGQANANSDRGSVMAGGDGWHRQRFTSTTNKDAGNTTAVWDGSGSVTMTPD